jgi:hypothetical protein
VTLSAKISDLKHQFSPHVASLNHPVRPGGVLQWKHVDQRYADQSTINQLSDLPHRIPSSVKVDNESDLAEASPLGFLAIALNIAVCGHCEDADQAAAGPEHIQRMRQGGRPYDVQNDINALCRPVSNRSAYCFRRSGYVRSAPAWLIRPVPEWSDVPQPNSACIPIAQRVAPIPRSVQ